MALPMLSGLVGPPVLLRPISSGPDMIGARLGRGQPAPARPVWTHEDDVVPPDAVPGPAGGLQPEAPQRLGRHRPRPVRPGGHGGDLPDLHRAAHLRRGVRVRRHLRQRAPQQRLRPDALPQPDRLDPGQPDLAGRDHRPRQLGRALQPARAGGRGVRHARPLLPRPAHRRVPGGHPDGHRVLVQRQPQPAPAEVLRGHRPHHEGVAGHRAVRLQRPVQPVPLRQPGASPVAASPPAGVDPRWRLGRDVGLLRRERLRLRRARPTTATRWCGRRSAATGARSRPTARTTTRTAWP